MFFIVVVPFFAFCNTIKVKDGLYYGYWVYKEHGAIKEYGVLANKPRKIMGKYILSPVPKFTDDNEIYVEVKGGVPTVYFYQKSVESDLNTVGWAGARFSEGYMVISSSTIRMVTKDTTENIFVGERVPGKKLKFEKDELVPLSLIDDNGFNVSCNQYLDVNAYRENGLPYYSEPDPEGRNGIEIGYPTTIFAVGELGICSAFLDDDIVPQIKKGWIQFRRLN
ncbi:hypothetical protein JBO44_04190 [Enterobacter asburiae]|uniref:hypothetical protein n=1 Tax=Enterobacter asburiae TaxID=61645 RepID=UPI00192AACCF|nr:hypothetical protein [Enterobacter asburiae]MBL5942547.1 hypothetical protein [Enterobacter asburiae]MBL5951183.1 hypothetical protein [Enterobacter asburiae]